MRIRNLTIDTNDLTIEEIDSFIKELRKTRERKGEARTRHQSLYALVENMKEDRFVFCSKHTGEILNPKDWVVYDNITKSVYPEEGENTDVD